MTVRFTFYAIDIDSGVQVIPTTSVDGDTLAAAIEAAGPKVQAALEGAAAPASGEGE